MTFFNAMFYLVFTKCPKPPVQSYLVQLGQRNVQPCSKYCNEQGSVNESNYLGQKLATVVKIWIQRSIYVRMRDISVT